MTTAETSVSEVKLGKYHLIVLAYFLLIVLGQYLLAHKYIVYIPAEWQSLATVTAVVFGIFQSLFTVAIIPLGMMFILCWLYLIDIKPRVRSLYPIVVTSLVPYLLLLVLAVIYVTFFVKVNIQPAAEFEKTINLIKEDIANITRQKSPVARFGFIAALLSIGLCAYLLHERLKLKSLMAESSKLWPRWLVRLHERVNLSVIIAVLIPLTFAGSLFVFNRLSGLIAVNLAEKLKLPQP